MPKKTMDVGLLNSKAQYTTNVWDYLFMADETWLRNLREITSPYFIRRNSSADDDIIKQEFLNNEKYMALKPRIMEIERFVAKNKLIEKYQTTFIKGLVTVPDTRISQVCWLDIDWLIPFDMLTAKSKLKKILNENKQKRNSR